MRPTRFLTMLTILLAAASFAQAQAQPAPGGEGGGRGGRGERGEQFRQQYEARMKELLGTGDEEWAELKPRIERVQQLQRESSTARGGFGMLFNRGSRGTTGGATGGDRGGDRAESSQPTSAVQERVRDLQVSIEYKDAPPEELKAKLNALREVRAQAKANLTQAQEELRGLLTVRQESVLVMMGVLE